MENPELGRVTEFVTKSRLEHQIPCTGFLKVEMISCACTDMSHRHTDTQTHRHRHTHTHTHTHTHPEPGR